MPSPVTFRPEEQIPFRYFISADVFVKGVADIARPGPKWMSALIVVPDAAGTETLYACYDRVKDLATVLNSGIAKFDDAHEELRPVRSTGPSPQLSADGRTTLVHASGESYFYFSGLRTDAPDCLHAIAYTPARPMRLIRS